jgi:hypothetical protein
MLDQEVWLGHKDYKEQREKLETLGHKDKGVFKEKKVT